jgi:phosphate transport system substrate-binding protein
VGQGGGACSDALCGAGFMKLLHCCCTSFAELRAIGAIFRHRRHVSLKRAGACLMSLSNVSAVLAALLLTTAAGHARENIQVAGSSTVLPYATIVAELFGENFDYRTPVVEGGGSGAGRKRMCEGLGEHTIDIANSSSRIKQSDIDTCQSNGVTEVMEIRFGYDGIVFASKIDGATFAFTPAHIYGAVAAEVMRDGAPVTNTHRMWSEIDPALPAQDILALIPGSKHGTREVFDEKLVVEGCKATGAFDAFAAAANGDEAAAKDRCMTLRGDGRSIEIDGDYTETLARLEANPRAVGVFGLSFYQSNTDRLKVATIDGVIPTVEAIASGEYPVSRPLYFYVKKRHIGVIPGLQDYVTFFLSDEVAGPDGPLADYGLVPDPELHATQAAFAAGIVMGPLE